MKFFRFFSKKTENKIAHTADSSLEDFTPHLAKIYEWVREFFNVAVVFTIIPAGLVAYHFEAWGWRAVAAVAAYFILCVRVMLYMNIENPNPFKGRPKR